MNSEDRTTILPAVGGPDASDGGRAARRAADRHRGRGRRGRRRRSVGPVVAVVAAVAGTGVIAALAGAGYGYYHGSADRDGQWTVALDPQIAAEAGDHNGIQIPGSGVIDPALKPSPTDSPSAADPAHAATATPAPSDSAAAGQSPSAGAAAPTASAPATASATAKPTSTASAGTAPKASTSAAATPPRTTAAPASGAPAGGTAAQYAQQVVDLVNAQRAQNGCGPLTADSRLATAAQGHSEDMAARNYFDHASPEGRHADYRIEATGYRWSSWGENIARGQKDPAAVMDAWMNSPGHRANILNCSFKQIGVGVKTGSGGPWWTQVFASPS
ncbi:CAP domain-containing protein [Kitasatospora sp. NPDC005751]|uniref:CAP domain-containing protein n=1 Tax=unclassified Kitasatospora TaxID=2633591 RepID=UPI0033C4A101